MKIIRIVALIILGLWYAGQPLDAISAPVSETGATPAAVRINESKDATEGQEKVDTFDETLRGGEEFSLLFFKGEKAFSRMQEQVVSFFTKPGSTIDTREWAFYIHRPEHHGVAAAGYCCLAIYQSPH